jgi:hypothetical protein
VNDLTDADIREALGHGAIHADAPPGTQGSIEWLMERCGYATCSRFADAMDFNNSGKESAKRALYRKQVACERITGEPLDQYVSRAMEVGIELEPAARMVYESRTGVIVEPWGFQRHPTIPWCGGSPDGRILPDGGIEIKCPTPITHLTTLIEGMSEDHLPQVQGLMWIFGAGWWDFMSYCPDFPEPHRTYIQRIPRDEVYISLLEKYVLQFLYEVEQLIDQLKGR